MAASQRETLIYIEFSQRRTSLALVLISDLYNNVLSQWSLSIVSIDTREDLAFRSSLHLPLQQTTVTRREISHLY